MKNDSKAGRLIKLLNGLWVYGWLICAVLTLVAFLTGDAPDAITVTITTAVLSQVPRAINYVMMGRAALFWKGAD